MKEKVEVKLTGENGNIYNLLAITKKAMTKIGQFDEADEMMKKVFKAGSYDEALGIIGEYVIIK